jgi:Mlc titration factor MtfA (ptsG expression regulator)
VFAFLKRHRREAVRAVPFPPDHVPFVARSVHLYSVLPAADRLELEGLVQVFLDEKRFEGAAGLEVTDEMKVTIAAQACLLLLHRDTDVYPELETVLVYPHAFVARATHREGPVVIEGAEARVGESWQRGLVIVAWDEVLRDARGLRPAHSVVVHEFAHQLDAEDGDVTGAPKLGSRARYVEWAHVLGEEYGALGERLSRGLATDIDAYGATSPAEFFAVVSEHFFEGPAALRKTHPALYDELVSFYRLDPAELLAPGSAQNVAPSPT